MSVTLLGDPHGHAFRLRLKRHLQRYAFYLAIVGTGWLSVYAIALPIRMLRGFPTPGWWWLAIEVPFLLLVCALALMFHVERLYRKVGL
jgi:hypothetical protein